MSIFINTQINAFLLNVQGNFMKMNQDAQNFIETNKKPPTASITTFIKQLKSFSNTLKTCENCQDNDKCMI